MKKLIRKVLNFSEVFRILNESFRGFRHKLVLLAFFGFLGGLLDSVGVNVLIPVFSFFTKSPVQSEDFISRNITKVLDYLPFQHNLIFLLGLAICLFLLRAFILVIFSYISYTTIIDFKNQSVRDLLKLVFGATWSFLLKQKLGYVQATIFRDMQITADTMVFLNRFIIGATGFFVYLIFALSISWGVTILTLLVGGAAALFLFPFVKKNRVISEKMAALEKSISGYLIESVSGIKNIKSFIVEVPVVEKGEAFYSKMKVLHMKLVIFRSFLSSFMQPLALVFISAVFYLFSKQPGFNLPAFIVTVYFIQKIFTYLENTQSAFHSVNEQVPFLKNILVFRSDLLNNKEDEGGSAPFKFTDRLFLKNISFAYNDDNPILDGVDIEIKKGEMIGLIGPSGVGKSSVADILLRFIRPTSGEMLLDTTSIENINVHDWRKHIGYVPQDVFIVNDTIENNIRFYDDGITREDIERGVKLANAAEFIERQKDGFTTIVGERGVMLSGGQRQRIVLARALARNPQILILDEATSSLDSESESLIQKSIQDLRNKVTIIIIAHRLSTVESVDRLLVLNSGKIEEEGRPVDLLKDKNSYFFKMYNMRI